MTYSPQVNDYVQWTKGVEGWVYFKDKEYITIETKVWPKHPEDQPVGTYHRNERVLVICYPQFYSELKYVHSRPCIDSPEEEYYIREGFVYGEK